MRVEDLRLHYRPENSLPNQIKQRRVSASEVADALRAEGYLVIGGDVRPPPSVWRVLNAAAAFGHPHGSASLLKDLLDAALAESSKGVE